MKPSLFSRQIICAYKQSVKCQIKREVHSENRRKSTMGCKSKVTTTGAGSIACMTTVGCYAFQTTPFHRLYEVPKERLGDLVPFPHQGLPQISDRVRRGSSIDAPLKLVPCVFNWRHVWAEGGPGEQGNVVLQKESHPHPTTHTHTE